MALNINDTIDGSYKSRTTEVTASSSEKQIQITFPNFALQLGEKIRGRSIKIDHCEIHYMPQIPINSTGIVRVWINDTRLGKKEDQKQAEYTFPVNCKCVLHFFGTSHSSVNEAQCPWVCKYQLENSNINDDVKFCKMKAYLKISSSKHPEDIEFRPPRIDIRSKIHNPSHVDFWHVGHTQHTKALCRALSTTSLPRKLEYDMQPGQSFQERRLSICNIPESSSKKHDDKEKEPLVQPHKDSNAGPSVIPTTVVRCSSTQTVPNINNKPLN